MQRFTLMVGGAVLGLVGLAALPAIADGFDDRLAGGSSLTTPVSLANGGTAAALTAVQGGVAYSGASALALSAAGTSGQVLKSNGTSAPSFADGYLAGGTDVALLDGGTNASLTAVAGGVCYSSASALALNAAGTSGQVLISGGTGAPTWTSSPTVTGITMSATGGRVTFGANGFLDDDGGGGNIRIRNAANSDQAALIIGYTQFASGGSQKALMYPGAATFSLSSDMELEFSSTTLSSGSKDVGLKRTAAGVVCATNGGGTCSGRFQTGPTNTASLDFGATSAGTCDLLTMTVTGAVDGDPVNCGVPTALAASDNYQSFSYYVSATNTVTVKRCNLTNITTALSDPAAATVRCTISR